MNEKIQCLRNKMRVADISGFLIENPKNIYYLTNIKAEGILLLTRKDNIFITDSRYIEEVKNILTIFDEITVVDQKNLSSDDYANYFLFCENIRFEENYLTYEKYREYLRKFKINNFVETKYLIENERLSKDDDEIQNITKACNITDSCFEYITKQIKPGMTEKKIKQLIDNYFIENSDGIAFETIVASGENTSKPHARATSRQIQQEDIITIDMGCIVNRYCSDMTRTFFVGNVDKSFKYVYNVVRQAQEQSLKDIKDLANIKNIVQKVENNFKLNGFTQSHALGHGVGLDIHEGPILSLKVNPSSVLKERMVVTSEPGIYLPGKFGVRIEDTVVVRKNESEALTKSSKEILII